MSRALSRVTVQVNDACLNHVVSNFNYKPANVGTYKDCKYTKSTMIVIFFLVASPFSIGEEAGGGGQGRDFINIHTAAQIAAIAVYITFGPPPPKWNCFLYIAMHFTRIQEWL